MCVCVCVCVYMYVYATRIGGNIPDYAVRSPFCISKGQEGLGQVKTLFRAFTSAMRFNDVIYEEREKIIARPE